jgi:hypothetical protein
MSATIELAPGAEENGLACMLSELVSQNLENKGHKRADFEALRGTVAIVAEDADVALTMRFERGRLTIHDGIAGIPDVTVRGDSESVLALSNMPLWGRLALPGAALADADGWGVLRGLGRKLVRRELRIHGALLHLPLLLRLTRVMSVNG